MSDKLERWMRMNERNMMKKWVNSRVRDEVNDKYKMIDHHGFNEDQVKSLQKGDVHRVTLEDLIELDNKVNAT